MVDHWLVVGMSWPTQTHWSRVFVFPGVCSPHTTAEHLFLITRRPAGCVASFLKFPWWNPAAGEAVDMESTRPRDVERSSSLQGKRSDAAATGGSLSRRKRPASSKRSIRALGNVVATEPASFNLENSPVRLISVRRLDNSYPQKAPAEINTFPGRGYPDFSAGKRKRPALSMENGGLSAEVPPPQDAVSKQQVQSPTQNGGPSVTHDENKENTQVIKEENNIEHPGNY